MQMIIIIIAATAQDLRKKAICVGYLYLNEERDREP